MAANPLDSFHQPPHPDDTAFGQGVAGEAPSEACRPQRMPSRDGGAIATQVHLPASWREAVAQRCEEASYNASSDQVQQRRADLEAEQKRLVQAFAKGYLPERDLDTQIDRIRAELQTLPSPTTRTANECT